MMNREQLNRVEYEKKMNAEHIRFQEKVMFEVREGIRRFSLDLLVARKRWDVASPIQLELILQRDLTFWLRNNHPTIFDEWVLHLDNELKVATTKQQGDNDGKKNS